MGAQLADIERIRRILREDRLILIGHSVGGFIATLYAAEFPQRVEKLVLLAPADMLTMQGEGKDLFELVRDRLPQDRRGEYEALLEEYLDFGSLFDHDEESLASLNLQLGSYILEAMGIAPDVVPQVPGLSETGGWMVHAIYLSLGRHHDYRDALSSIESDTLVVHGDRDLAPPSASAQYVQLIANAELLRVPDADHFFWGDHPNLQRRVTAFLTAE
jgi:proline iminopeptidase